MCVEPAGLCGRCTGVAVPLRVVPSPTGLPSKRRGRLRGFLELRRPWGYSPEARRGSQGASRAAPGKKNGDNEGSSTQFILVSILSVEKRRGDTVPSYGESMTLGEGLVQLQTLVLRAGQGRPAPHLTLMLFAIQAQ